MQKSGVFQIIFLVILCLFFIVSGCELGPLSGGEAADSSSTPSDAARQNFGIEGTQNGEVFKIGRVKDSIISNCKYWVQANVPTRWRDAISAAIAQWNGVSGTSVHFTPANTAGEANITFKWNYFDSTNLAARTSSFPHQNGDPGDSVTINQNFDDSCIRANWARGARNIIMHEIGHAIGMRHMNLPQSAEPFWFRIPGTPERDTNSIFDPYIENIRYKPGFSNYDKVAIRYVYPSSGSYILVYEDANYMGRNWIIQFPLNQSDLGSILLNDRISSMKFYGGARLTLYEDANYGGRNGVVPLPDLPEINGVIEWDDFSGWGCDEMVSSLRWPSLNVSVRNHYVIDASVTDATNTTYNWRFQNTSQHESGSTTGSSLSLDTSYYFWVRYPDLYELVVEITAREGQMTWNQLVTIRRY